MLRWEQSQPVPRRRDQVNNNLTGSRGTKPPMEAARQEAVRRAKHVAQSRLNEAQRKIYKSLLSYLSVCIAVFTTVSAKWG